MFGKRRLDWLCLLGIFCLLLNTDITTQAQTQNKRSSRITSSRSFGTNVKQTSSNGVNFDCPEEFGYYPHPTDCTQYYVCVFGGALLESCTGGLMYSHELQTCDWPRNVGCEVVDNGAAASAANSRDSNSGRGNKHQQQSQHVPSRVRFGSAFTSAAASTPQPQKPTVPPQYHRQPPQTIQAQVQNIPPPPELKVPPNPVITSRGQPKPLLDSQEDIAKLYADALDALPSVEEEDSERQQRVYRGQPSTVSQVQRDRDGIIHQASINAIPNHGKIGSYAFGSQFRVESSSPSSQSPTPANLYVQPQRPTKVIVETIPSNRNQLINRNYYNTSTLNHGVYESQLPPNIQEQQQIPLQHQQQQQQQAQPEQSSYDTYYSVYDDDIDLYRDIEYQQQHQQQQHNRQQQQQQQQQQDPQQYQSQQPIRQQQTTYRPLEILTTPTPQQVPIRETYINKPLSSQKTQNYNNQQSLIYNTDYEEDLIAQIEQDNVYDQPTRSPSRSKQHANKIHKNQLQKSQQPKPTTHSPPPLQPLPQSKPLSNPAIQTQTPKPKSLIEVVTPIQAQPFRAQNSEISKSLNVVANRYQSLQDNDSVYSAANDNIKLPQSRGFEFRSADSTTTTTTTTTTSTTPRAKLLALVNAEGFATSPRGNLLRTNTEKPYRGKSSEEINSKSYEDYNNKHSADYRGKYTLYYNSDDNNAAKLSDQQRKRIQSYVLSDVEPQSFKPPPAANKVHLRDSTEPVLELLSSASSSSSTTIRYPTNVPQEPKPFKYSLETGTNGFRLRAEQHTFEQLQEAPAKPIYERLPITQIFTTTTTPLPTTTSTPPTTTTTTPITTTTTTTTRKPYVPNEQVFNNEPVYDEIVPTTYAPPLRIWRNGRPSVQPNLRTEIPSYFSDGFYDRSIAQNENNLSHNLKREYPSTIASSTTTTTTTTTTPAPITEPTTTSTTTTTTYKPPTTTTTTTTTTSTTPTPPPTPPTTERAIQSFTARSNVFKDNLIKTTGSPAHRFVSPYKSLETILQEKDDRYGSNSIRTTSKPRYTNPTTALPYLQTTNKSLRSYFLITTPPRNLSDALFATMSSGVRNFSISDAILSTFSTVPLRPAAAPTNIAPIAAAVTTTTTTTTSTTAAPTSAASASTASSAFSTIIATSPIRVAANAQNLKAKIRADYSAANAETPRPRGRSRYTAATVNNLLENDEPTTYSPKYRLPTGNTENSTPANNQQLQRRKPQRARVTAVQPQRNNSPIKPREKYQAYKSEQQVRSNANQAQKSYKRKPIENEAYDDRPRAEALVQFPIDTKQDNSIETSGSELGSSTSTEHVVAITDRPLKYFYSNKYRQQTAEHTLAESLQNAGYIASSTGRSKYRPTNVLEQLQLFLAGDSDESSSQQFVDDFSEREIEAAVQEIKNLYLSSTTTNSPITASTVFTTTQRTPTITSTTTLRPTTTSRPATVVGLLSSTTRLPSTNTQTSTRATSLAPQYPSRIPASTTLTPNYTITYPVTASNAVSTPSFLSSSTTITQSSTAKYTLPPTRASRVNNAIKSSIAAAASGSSGAAPNSFSSSSQASTTAAKSKLKATGINSLASNPNAAAGSAVKCSDNTSNAKCNEIPTRINANSNNSRNRGSAHYANQDRDIAAPVTSNRGTHPPRTRPTLKPSGTIVSKAQEFIDIYKNPPTRPDPLYPQPTPDKTAAKCRKDVCLLPDCSCGGKEIPGDLPVESVPQIVLLTFDDSVNDLNKQLYTDLFEKGRVNPNGCPITATFYVSHEWTDYSQVQNLYADGHEMASHTVSHSFGEQFSQKKWTREVAGQREILSAYGGVKLSDVRGMRAPFLSVGGNKMYKMLYDSNFTYDSSMPVYENRPPSWPYTLDYKIFHDCMIPPCPTKSYPGVWQVPMVMWQDLNGGRCSMGDACSNPSEADGVYKMIMKNFERHYTTNRAPFGLFYHAAWFTQPHHKEGFIKFLDAINAMPDVWIITNWQMLQWVRDPTPNSRINSFQPFQCDYSDRPKRCNNPKVCNLWHKSGVRYMKTCQPCPDIYPWTGKTGIRSSRIDNDIEDSTA